MMDTQTAAVMAGGVLRGHNVLFNRVTTDSRALAPGDFFVALSGDRFDGHAFVGAAHAQGAVAAMVAAPQATALGGNLVVVGDTLTGLQRLAREWRKRFTLPLIVVTGSNGKTTVKEMIASILRTAFTPDGTLATQGSLNNHIGLPLTLLALRATHKAAVIELGMNHRGETRELAALALPTIALVNNAQREHQEFMVSVDAVAQEHADAILALPEGGTAVVNADDLRAEVWRRAARLAGADVMTFGLEAGADVHGQATLHADGSALRVTTRDGVFETTLAVPGIAMARNALGATAAALAAGVPLPAIAAGLAAFRPVAGRLVRKAAPNNVTVIDDSYNANPDSVRAAIDVLARAQAPRWLVLGDMGEVGADGPAFHREIGNYARASGIDRLYASGDMMRDAVAAFGAQGRHFDAVDVLAATLRAEPPPAGATVLVKGSRFMRMERAAQALTGVAVGGDH
jgi:UDP-N-acetylmuramoyl-tripeptide--D-alanyl-D-alanine ligase